MGATASGRDGDDMAQADDWKARQAGVVRQAMTEFTHIMGTDRTDRVAAAFSIACRAHEGQSDKAGRTYVTHPITVASNVGHDEDAIIVALLHDVVEDGGVSLDDIREEFGDTVADAVGLLTHDKSMTYGEYIDRIATSGNMLAIRVKIADLAHNMCVSRIDKPTHRDGDRAILRYASAYTKLVDALCG